MTSLGICIPTYKRPEFLRRCVISALSSAGDRSIKIFITDDSGDDTNSDLFDELKSLSDSIVIQRNTINLGIDDNIQACIDLCDCDYAWIVGEDDYFLPGAVKRIHDFLQEAKDAFVFANYSYVSDVEGQVLGKALEDSLAEIQSLEFISRHLWAVGFIGACIINRTLWNKTSPVPYKDSYYTHVGRICELLSFWPDPVRIVGEPCVANRVEGSNTFTWKHDSYGVFFGFCAMCEAVSRQCPILSTSALRAAQVMGDRYGWLSIRLAMRLRSEMGYDFAQYKLYLAPNTQNPFKRIAFYIISITPPICFRPLVFMYRLFLRPLL